MEHRAQALLSDFLTREALPTAYEEAAQRYFLPLAEETAALVREGSLRVLGIAGNQGSGKSTLAGLLGHWLKGLHGLRVAVLSLDDFYLPRAERQRLAQETHPLLVTRGVPGTHDLPLALETLGCLLEGRGSCSLPHFDKGLDDRSDPGGWQQVEAPVDLVILEGWCLMAEPQDEAALRQPVNELEAREDPDGRWRRYVNRRLREDYASLFARIDYLVYLQAPDFQSVFRWRQRQEAKLTAGAGPDRRMDPAALERFVGHFERLSRRAMETLPGRADQVLVLNDAQNVVQRRRNDRIRDKS